MDLNTLAVRVAELEGKKVQVNVAQIKEVEMRKQSVGVVRDKLLYCSTKCKIGRIFRPVKCPVSLERTTEYRCSRCIHREE